MTTEEKVEKTKLSQEDLDLLLISAEDADIARWICETKGHIYKTRVIDDVPEVYKYDEKIKLWRNVGTARNVFRTEYETDMKQKLNVLLDTCIADYGNCREKDKDGKAACKEKEKLIKAAMKKLKSHAKAKAVAGELVLEPYLDDPVFFEKLNSNKVLLPIKDNKVLNIETGKIFDRTEDHYFSQGLNVRYDETKVFHGGKYFMDLATPEKKELRDPEKIKELAEYMAFLFGLCMTRKMYKNLWQLIGIGSNGKTMFLDLLGEILGTDFGNINTSFLSVDKNSSSNGHGQNIITKRYCKVFSINEPTIDTRLDNSKIKRFADYNPVIDERAIQVKTQVVHEGTFKILVATNDPLKLSVRDAATAARIVMVPFRNKFKKDNKLYDNYKKNKDGILDGVFTHAINTFMKLSKLYGSELPPCKYVEEATAAYIAEQKEEDGVEEILEEIQAFGISEYITTKDVNDIINKHCINNPERKRNAKKSLKELYGEPQAVKRAELNKGKTTRIYYKTNTE